MYYGVLSETRVQWCGETKIWYGLETASKSWESKETFEVQVHLSGEANLLGMVEISTCHLLYWLNSFELRVK